jgi:tRNA (cytidine/uridine-2'-O-)-methyltransferase
MLHIILYRPEIPQNTGNIGRLCAITSCRLHLVHPLGFKLTDRYLKRSGMDYWESLDIVEHKDWESLLESPKRPSRIWLLSTHAEKVYWDQKFEDEDGFLFGNEGSGCPAFLHEWASERRLTIPHYNENLRSINLATSAGIVLYEALRQVRR